MTNKQIIVMILAFTLVALFCATGVFAEDPVLVLSQSPTMAMKASNYQYWYKTLDVNPAYICSYVDGNYTKMVIGSPFNSGIGFSTSENGTYQTRPYNSSPSDGIYFLEVSNQTATVQIDNTTHYSSFSACIQAISDYFEGTQTAAFSQDMTVPAGYALRIYSSDSFTLQELVFAVPNSWNFPSLSGSSQRYNGARFGLVNDSLIVQGGSADSGSYIPWTALNANLFGRASSYSYSFSPDYPMYSGLSYVVTNPLYTGEAVQNESAAYHQNTDMLVTVYYSALSSTPVYFDLVPLKQSLSADNGVIYYQNKYDLDSGVIHGTVTPGVDDQPGSVDFGNPPAGGGNADQPPLSENTTIFGVLSTLTSTITDLFNRAGDAMRSLVQSSNSFFTAVIGFFGWLPPEWSAVMWSFFLVLTVLGVVKLFL